MKYDSHKKSILKSIIWRLLSIILLTTVTWIYTRNWLIVEIIILIHNTNFLVIFYLHERIWQKNTWPTKPILKAITYEIILTSLILGYTIYLISGSWLTVSGITLTYIPIKFIIYPIYDVLWKSKKIVYAYVVADLIHFGHLRHLEIGRAHV